MRITANQVTIARLLAMPLLGALAYGAQRTHIVAVIHGTLIGLTDTVDGYLARKHGSTVLGSLLDPVADKVFIVVCYGCCADLGLFSWAITAAILSRELLVTVLRSSLELRGLRLPSSNAAKAKTWVQMMGIGFVVLIPIMPSPTALALLFGVPLAGGIISLAIVASIRRRRYRPLEFAIAVLIGFLSASLLGGVPAARIAVLGFVVAMTWFTALDYLAAGARVLAPRGPHRFLHWARLVAGAALPVVAMVAMGMTRLPTVPLIILLSVDMARGALDNYAAHRRITDFSWAASLWAELALLGAAIALPGTGTNLTIIAMLIGVTETLRSLARYFRTPAAAPAARPVVVPATAPANTVAPTPTSGHAGAEQ
jgi:CDP-diacylglycerol--glycerol-3-phosphate 3-phosphatidyltransferase